MTIFDSKRLVSN